jgi:hypothetical protein
MKKCRICKIEITPTPYQLRHDKDSHLELSQRAHELAATMRWRAPEARSLLPHLRPMSFKRTREAKFSIEPMVSECWEVASMRHMVLFGVKPFKVNFGTPITFHKLVGPRDGNGGIGTLTSDQPVEVYSQYIAFRKCHGRVLVGGLGLGMAAQMILDLPRVTSVTVVERDSRIIKLMQGQIDPRIKIVKSDLFEFLKIEAFAGQYDSAYYDIWYGTGESDWVENVVPLYRLSRRAGINGELYT